MLSGETIIAPANSADETASAAYADAAGSPVQLAVFDFDGTSITGNSPVMLVRYLFLHRLLGPGAMARIILWGLRYKLQLPQNESWVRGQVFRAFEGWPVDLADKFMASFYDEVCEARFRADADAAMIAHAEMGYEVIVVSATFEPILRRAMAHHPFHNMLSTRMKVDENGKYTREVDGLPMEGDEKLAALKRYADERWGEGGWELSFAYGDHHSDLTLLEAAAHPNAVTPDNPLERTAKRRNWPILNWE